MKFLDFLFFSEKIEETCFTTKVAFATKTFFVQISFCSNLFVFRKISVSPAFSEKVFLYHIFFFSFTIYFRKNLFRKIVFCKKKKASFYLSRFSFLFEEKSFLFFNCFLNFCLRALCFSLFLFLFCFFW